MKHLIAPVIATCLTLPAQARWFEVEVLLFSRNQDPTQLSEDFTQSRFVPMSIRKSELLSSVLLAPTDCPELENSPEQPKNNSELEQSPEPQTVQYDEFGFPLETKTEQQTKPQANTQQPESIDEVLTQVGVLSEQPNQAESATSLTQRGNPNTVQSADEIEAGVTFDEFGLPVEAPVEPERTPEEQAAYELWLAECQKPKALNGYDQLPTTIVSHQLPADDQQRYVLTTEQLQLSDALAQLTAKANYQPMLHTGWRFDVQSKRQMPAIHLVAGRNFGQQFSADGWGHIELSEPNPVEETLSETDGSAETSNTPLASEPLLQTPETHPPESNSSELNPSELKPSELETLTASENGGTAIVPDHFAPQIETPEPPRQPAVWEMEADLRIWLASWLHMEVQSTLRKEGRKLPELDTALDPLTTPVEESAEAQETGSLVTQPAQVPYLYRYHLDQFRRVRSGEIHYFDHPLMGLIIQIRPYTPRPSIEPEAEQEQLSETSTSTAS